MTEKKENEILTQEESAAIAKRTAAVGVFGNVLLAGFKLIAGIVGHSAAMMSDSVHSLSDVFATAIAYVGRKIADKPADEGHPYGHERFECLASIALGIILIMTGVQIGVGCAESIANKTYLDAEVPGMIALIAAIVSILTKEGMFWYTRYQARRIKSSAFEADAWHHRSDAMSSIGALVGIAGARMGFPVMDQIAGLVIAIVILIVAAQIIGGAVNKMMDHSASPEVEKEMKDSILAYAESEKIDIVIDSLITREFGDKLYVDLEIGLDGNMKLKDAHDIAEHIHKFIEENYSDVKHVMVHINPAGYEYTVRD